MANRLISIPEAAAFAGISRASIYRLIKAKRLPVIKILSRTLIDPNDISNLIVQSKSSLI